MKHFICLLTFILSIHSYTQENKVDSLKGLITKIKNHKNPESISELYFNISSEYFNLREYDSILVYGKLTLENTINDTLRLKSHLLLSTVYNIKNHDNLAISSLHDALNVIEESPNLENYKRRVFFLLGVIQRGQKFYDKAERNMKKVIALSDTASTRSKMLALAHNELGRIYKETVKRQKAEKHYLKALKLYEIQKRYKGMGKIHNDLASLYIREEKYEEAFYHANQALNIYKKKGVKRDLDISYSQLGRIYNLKNEKNFDSSYFYLNKAKEIYSEKKALKHLMFAEYHLFNNFLLQNKTSEAFKHIELYKSLRDSLEIITNKKATAELETKYKTEQKEKELAQQKIVIQEQELLTQKANTRNWLLAIGLLAIGISAFFIWRRYKLEQKAKLIISNQKDDIEYKKTQIEHLQQEFHHRLKNDFRSINSYISLVQQQFTDTDFNERLNELKNRVTSMFKVHEILLKEDDITQVKAKPYLSELTKNVEEKFKDKKINLSFTIDETETIIADKAIPFGIVLNEFVTNSYKYAFDGKGGEVKIEFKSDNDNHHLLLKDNGKGLPDGFNIEKLRSLGMRIIPMYANLHDGSYELDGSNGVSLTLTLPKKVA